jgi:ABC-type transport system substrate-binding protein
VYDWNVLNRIFDSLMNVDPFTKDDRMWGASSYQLSEWIDTPNNIHGLNISFKIRDGIQWQDGQEYNASSAKWSWDFCNSTRPPRYQDTWEFYMGSEVIDRLNVRIYLNITGIWYLYSVAGTAMMWHKPIWEK